MERFKNITIIFLLVVVLPASAALSQSASVLLQEGLYAEEIEGNLDAAIKIYRQVIAGSKDMEQTAAQATYRIAMCHLKKGDEAAAAKYFRKAVNSYPKQISIAKKAQAQLDKITPNQDDYNYSFSHVFTQIINDDGVCEDFMFDLDKGKSYSVSDAQKANESLKKSLEDFVMQSGVDLFGETSKKSLMGINIIAFPVHNEQWDMSPEDVIEQVSLGKPGTPVALSADGELPKTFVFKTGQGGMGILQIIEMQEGKAPRHFKIQYKMLQNEDSGYRRVFLPDADTSGANVVLDLASGELLPAGEGEQQLVGTFAELGKGDLAYDRFIICLRDAVAKLRKEDELTELTKVEQIEDVTAYQLPSAPCRLLVTTTEGDKYDVTVLSVSGSGLYLGHKILSEQAVREGFSPAWDVAEAFLAAAVSGRDSHEAIKLVKPGSAVVRQVKDFRQILNPEKLKIVSMYADERIAVVTTTEINVDDQKGLMLIRLIKQRGIWMVEDVDLETPDSLKAELDSFLKKHPNAKKLQEVHFRYKMSQKEKAKSPIDLSTPEATIKSFVKAVYDGNLEAAKACVSKDGTDYDEFKEMLATESNHPFQAMIKAMDVSVPVEITNKDVADGKCKIKWYLTLGRVYYFGENKMKKKGTHQEFGSYLEFVGGKWLIRDI